MKKIILSKLTAINFIRIRYGYARSGNNMHPNAFSDHHHVLLCSHLRQLDAIEYTHVSEDNLHIEYTLAINLAYDIQLDTSTSIFPTHVIIPK